MKFSAYVKGIERLYISRDLKLVRNRPATAVAVERLERKYGFQLPAELRSAFLATNGTPKGKPFFARPGFLTSYSFLSATSVLEHREVMRKRAPRYGGYVEAKPRDNRIASGWYCDGWLPFGEFGGGSLLLMVDSSPGKRGTPGQIVAYTHDPDEISFVAPSFERFLADSLKAASKDPDEFLGIY